MSEFKAIKVGSTTIILNHIESYSFDEKLNITKITMTSGEVFQSQGNITGVIEQLLSISVTHIYKELSI
ncbi:hypothetical protein [Thalassotalea piscium]|uniref:Uncharacterized protein n=1 Tax=Thalassotalea piscium TaxID=1230533 RepID=A0A7X0TTH9_9GAMM|nr:hypothetical protein [Thalassotalea piscium]MBB6543105.1 hypothetical protein [Thalassotalea piscium]